jgi:hypothetical protein
MIGGSGPGSLYMNVTIRSSPVFFPSMMATNFI